MFAEFELPPARAVGLDTARKSFAQRDNKPCSVVNGNAVAGKLTIFSVFVEDLESYRAQDVRRMFAVGVSSSAPMST